MPLVGGGDLIAKAEHTILAGVPETVRITNVTTHATEADVEQGRVSLGMLRLMLLLTRGGVISLRRLWIPGGPCSKPGIFGIPSCISVSGS